MPRLLSAVTNGTDARTGNGTVPASLDGLDRKGRKPFKWIGPSFAGLIGGNICTTICSSGATRARILLRIDDLKTITIRDIGNN